MMKIMSDQAQQMALYFTAKEIKDPLQVGSKEISVNVGLKAVPKEGLY